MIQIPVSKPSITKKEIDNVNDAISSGWISSLGPYMDKFENALKEYFDVPSVVLMSNGTSALHLAQVVMGIDEKAEVLVPALTFVATANSAKYNGSSVKLIDIETNSKGMCTKDLEKTISAKTKLLIPVHLYGIPCDIEEIEEIAIKHKLMILEDAAEAFGAKVNGRKVGTFGTCSIFSFFGNKTLTTGEGGVILSHDKEIGIHAKKLRDHGMKKDRRYWHDEIGYNYRMTNLQAAIGVAQLSRIESITAKRREIHEMYKSHFPKNEILRLVNFPNTKKKESVCWLQGAEFPVATHLRDELIDFLKLSGIESRPYFFPLSKFPMYEDRTVELKNSVDISKMGICLPTFHDMTEDEIKTVCHNVGKFLEKHS